MGHVDEVNAIIKKLRTHGLQDTECYYEIMLLVKKCKELAIDVDAAEVIKDGK